MNMLVLGASGLLGHEVFTEGVNRKWQVWGTCSKLPEKLVKQFPAFERTLGNHLDKLLAYNVLMPGYFGSLRIVMPKGLTQGQFDVVVNTIGIVKKRIKNLRDCVAVNSLFPHVLSEACTKNTYLIHISTDCVFDGKRGNYTENDHPTAEDHYGLTKALGEIRHKVHLTLRTSFIGEELIHPTGLLNWFDDARGKVAGYKKAIWTGFTAPALARLSCDLAIHRPAGLYHVGCEPISKFDLLNKLKEHFNRDDLQIMPDISVVCDRSLSSRRLIEEVNIRMPSIDEMIADLCVPE